MISPALDQLSQRRPKVLPAARRREISANSSSSVSMG